MHFASIVYVCVCVCACMCVYSTWLPILMGGPLGPPAKRGDMKDYDRNNIAPWDFNKEETHSSQNE